MLILVQIALRYSAYPHDTTSGALLYCAYAMLCFLSGQSMVRSSQARKLAVILTLYGFVLAAFALLQGIAPNGKLYWVRQPRAWAAGFTVHTSTTITTPGLMELLVPIPLVLR